MKIILKEPLRLEFVNYFYGLVPGNGKTYSIESILSHEDYYRKLADEIEKKGSRNRPFKRLNAPGRTK